MAASVTPELPIGHSISIDPAIAAGAKRRRISSEAGHALEILGHAIEYLVDEYLHDGGCFVANDPQLQAVLVLMELNRQVYFECPEVPSLRERLHSFLDRHLR
ncbi:MAG: hypothetical protein KGM96_16115 [Acidobacteriota bacterium]|nr:hypothetical protein [Acidobacteriota bacterium]